MKIKIPLHSTTDLITNSSTVIFTYSENSVGALKQHLHPQPHFLQDTAHRAMNLRK